MWRVYAVVNDAANEGAAITLAPGTYVLSATMWQVSGDPMPDGWNCNGTCRCTASRMNDPPL